MTPLGRLVPPLRPRHTDAVIGAAAYAARAFAPALGLKALARMVLAALILRSRVHKPGAERRCFATETELAEDVGCTSRSVRKALGTLAAAKLVSRSAVMRGDVLPDGTTAANHRVVLEIAELPRTDVCGLRGALAGVFDGQILLTAVEKAVLAVVLLHEGEDGFGFPGPQRIATMTGLSVRAVKGHLSDLVERGYLHVRRQRRRTGEQTPPRLLRANLLRGKPLCAAEDGVSCRERRAAPADRQPVLHPAVHAVLVAHKELCDAPAGDRAVEIVEARLADGMTVSDLETALIGVMTVAWRRERLERRTIARVFATKRQAMEFASRVDAPRAEPANAASPVRVTPEEVERRRQALASIQALKRPNFA